MNDIDVARLILKQIKADSPVLFTTLRLQFYNLCQGSTAKFANYITFLVETGAVKINHESQVIEKVS